MFNEWGDLTERLGKAYLANKLLSEDILLAYPESDLIIDFIAYRTGGLFESVPVKLKIFAQQGFYTDENYGRVPDLRIVYLWDVGSDFTKIRAFCLPHHKAEEIANSREFPRKNGVCFTHSLKHLLDELQSFEVTSWRESLFTKG